MTVKVAEIEIENLGMIARNTRIFLNGVEISPYVLAFSIESRAGGITTVTVTMPARIRSTGEPDTEIAASMPIADALAAEAAEIAKTWRTGEDPDDTFEESCGD